MACDEILRPPYFYKDFIICLGYKADKIKDYFLHYDECISNDFVLSGNSKNVTLITSDTQDWNITFVDTGFNTCIGQRLAKVRHLLENEEYFFANYSDGLTALPLPKMLNKFKRSGKVAPRLSARHPRRRFTSSDYRPAAIWSHT